MVNFGFTSCLLAALSGGTEWAELQDGPRIPALGHTDLLPVIRFNTILRGADVMKVPNHLTIR